MIYLIHTLPSNQYVIPLDADAALDKRAFATYHDEDGRTQEVTHGKFGWLLPSAAKNTAPPEEGKKQKKAKYEGHTFELCVTPEHLDRAIAALQWAKENFAAATLPVRYFAPPVDAEDEEEAEE